MPIYSIKPNDVLFFRDGRPFEAGGGHGVNWPLPSLLFDAIHAALYRAYPDVQEDWEHQHRIKGTENRKKRFGSLNTAGPFPILGNDWLFPAPADLAPDENKLAFAPIKPIEGAESDLPKPLKYAVGALLKPSKAKPKSWMTRYGRVGTDELYAGEWVTGIGIDPDTQAQNGEQLYSAEYMRLKEDVRMGVWASLPLKERNGEEGLEKLLQDGSIVIMGGQQRACSVNVMGGTAASPSVGLETLLPLGSPITGDKVKWSLLSPALFPAIGNHPGGWLPTWVHHETGQVMLRKGGVGGGKAKRKGLTEGSSLNVHLVAAIIPKPVVLSGWDVQANGAKPTMLAAPAGAVYYFEGPDAPALADLLNWHGTERLNVTRVVNRRSSLMGEKGFGLGVCGPWDFYEDVVRRPNAGESN